jgi:hypothetical protein
MDEMEEQPQHKVYADFDELFQELTGVLESQEGVNQWNEGASIDDSLASNPYYPALLQVLEKEKAEMDLPIDVSCLKARTKEVEDKAATLDQNIVSLE